MLKVFSSYGLDAGTEHPVTQYHYDGVLANTNGTNILKDPKSRGLSVF